MERDHMTTFSTNGSAFSDYWQRWDLTAHWALSPEGELICFAITGTEGRGGSKAFLYELHVRIDFRGRGVGTALLEISARGRG